MLIKDTLRHKNPEFIEIPKGEFNMGRGTQQKRVRLSESYKIGKFPITQGQWLDVMGENPSFFDGITNPVECVSWEDCQIFLRKLNNQDNDNIYRLPTDAEWEYASKGGNDFYADFLLKDQTQLVDYAWYEENSEGMTHPVGYKIANSWGLHDMFGNVAEWCSDWYKKVKRTSNKLEINPMGPVKGYYKVTRGGCYLFDAGSLSTAERAGFYPETKSRAIGFRIVIERRFQ